MKEELEIDVMEFSTENIHMYYTASSLGSSLALLAGFFSSSKQTIHSLYEPNGNNS